MQRVDCFSERSCPKKPLLYTCVIVHTSNKHVIPQKKTNVKRHSPKSMTTATQRRTQLRGLRRGLVGPRLNVLRVGLVDLRAAYGRPPQRLHRPQQRVGVATFRKKMGAALGCGQADHRIVRYLQSTWSATITNGANYLQHKTSRTNDIVGGSTCCLRLSNSRLRFCRVRRLQQMQPKTMTTNQLKDTPYNAVYSKHVLFFQWAVHCRNIGSANNELNEKLD